MRIFKTKTLARFTRQHGISDKSLVEAVHRAMRGMIDADLGGQVIKQRVARPGQGKRGGFRMLIGFGQDRAYISSPSQRTSEKIPATANCSPYVKSRRPFSRQAKRKSRGLWSTEL